MFTVINCYYTFVLRWPDMVGNRTLINAAFSVLEKPDMTMIVLLSLVDLSAVCHTVVLCSVMCPLSNNALFKLEYHKTDNKAYTFSLKVVRAEKCDDI